MPYVEETKVVRQLTSDLTGRTRSVEDKPEAWKPPATKDYATLYLLPEEAEALTAFLTTGDGTALRTEARTNFGSNGTDSKVSSEFASKVREWAKPRSDIDAGERGRVKGAAYEAYFKANPDVAPPEGAAKEAHTAHTKVHAAS